MNKNPLHFSVLAVLLFGFVGLSAGQSSQQDLIKPITKKLIFIYIPKVVHPWYDVVHDGANFAVDEFKKLGIGIEIIWDAPPQANIDDQNRRIEAAIGRRPDGLCVASLDPSTNAQILDEAANAKLNVMTFDTFCAERFRYVGHNKDEQDGYDLGKVLAEKLSGKGKVGILSGSLTAPNHVARVKGFKRAMEEYPKIQIVFEKPDNDNLEAAVSLTENALQANPDLAGIFACNASNPIGAARAISNAGKAGKILIVGMDDLPETISFIKDGTILATKAQRQWEIGYWTVHYMVAINQGHTVPQEHETGARFLTADSLKK
jgi:ribose transport system substrate-binding protein